MFGSKTRKIRDRDQLIDGIRAQRDTARADQGTAEFNLRRALQRIELLEADTASLESQLANARILNERLNNQIRCLPAAPGRAA